MYIIYKLLQFKKQKPMYNKYNNVVYTDKIVISKQKNYYSIKWIEPEISFRYTARQNVKYMLDVIKIILKEY